MSAVRASQFIRSILFVANIRVLKCYETIQERIFFLLFFPTSFFSHNVSHFTKYLVDISLQRKGEKMFSEVALHYTRTISYFQL